MAFHHVAADQGGVARAQLLRQAQPCAHGVVAGFVHGHLESIGLHVVHPILAAAAVGVFPHFDRRRDRPGSACQGRGQGRHRTSAEQRQRGGQPLAAAEGGSSAGGGTEGLHEDLRGIVQWARGSTVMVPVMPAW